MPVTKILFITTQFPNPVEELRGIFNFNAVNALMRNGCQVLVVNPLPMVSFKKLIKRFSLIGFLREIKAQLSVSNLVLYKGVNVRYLLYLTLPYSFIYAQQGSWLNIFIGRRIKKLVNSFEPSLILTSEMVPNALLSNAIRRYYKGKIFSLMIGSDILIKPQKFRGWNSILTNLNQNIDINICASHHMRNVAIERGLNHLAVIHNGFDSSSFHFNKIKKNNERFRLITVGHLYHIKGHDILLNSLLYLDGQIDFSLTIRGDGYKKESYLRFIEENNLQAKVVIIDKVNSLSELLNNHDLFIMPSRSEGLPAAILEAMACGLPVVASNVGGMPEVIIEGFNGFLFDPENEFDLAKKINLSCSQKWKSSEISDWVKSNYSWDIWASKIINLKEDGVR